MSIPAKSDWGEIDKDDLDANHAFEQFFEKSFQEAINLFEQNALFYQEDLQSMPPSAFNFYAPALVEYLNSGNAAGDSDGASSFLRMFIWMLKTNREVISKESGHLLFETSFEISQKQDFYDADIDIYGKFSDLFEEIKYLVWEESKINCNNSSKSI